MIVVLLVQQMVQAWRGLSSPGNFPAHIRDIRVSVVNYPSRLKPGQAFTPTSLCGVYCLVEETANPKPEEAIVVVGRINIAGTEVRA